MELVESAPHADLALAVLAPNVEAHVLLEPAPPSLPLLNADGDVGVAGEDWRAVSEFVGFKVGDFVIGFVPLIVRVHLY